jgi:hypothetical protein
MELEDPRSLDKPFGFWDDEYEQVVHWHGVLKVDNDDIYLSEEFNDATQEEYDKQRRLAREARVAEEAAAQRPCGS